MRGYTCTRSHNLVTSDRATSNQDQDQSSAELLSLVYAQLRQLAQRNLESERPGHTLTATALVHEAYLRLSENRRVPWGSEAHYYVAAAEAMRQILLDHARSPWAAHTDDASRRAGIRCQWRP